MFGLRKLKHHILSKRSPSCAILMYHHIRSEKADPWETCVSEGHFKEQLNILGNYYDVYPLSSLEEILLQRDQKKKKIFITFDDGYLDNYEVAVPELKLRDFSATFFIPTQILNGAEYFWWEIVDHLFWGNEKLPEQIELTCDKNHFTTTFSSSALARDFQIESSWSANNMPPPTERCRIYLDICNWIKQRSNGEQQLITHQLMALCKNEYIESCRKMSAYQIKKLSEEDFEIGAHTVHHSALGFQTNKVQQNEITAGKMHLEKLICKPVTSIAYPHGHFNSDTINITKSAGYALGCTTEAGFIHADSDKFALPRMWVKNINGASFQQQLSSLFNK